jgi:FtsP/CotA-like multicopper oxidase with cupredoxin domain
MRIERVGLAWASAALVLGACAQAPQPAVVPALPNDNRTAAGTMRDGVLELHLVARLAGFRPDLGVDSLVTVQAFAEPGREPTVPGPLLRTTSGTEVRVHITNDIADSTLVVYGLRAGTAEDDTIHVRPGAERAVTFRAGSPGTFLYWGTTSSQSHPASRMARDGQLTGAIVIDAPGTTPHPDERIFVMTVIDILPDTLKPPDQREDIWELAINGLAWPHSERLEYGVGDTIRWRVLNGSYLSHPMHLHGFHFRVTAKGDGQRDVMYAPHEVRDVVTEFMPAGSTFAMEWTPTRAGNWLFHCHMAPHITPFPERPDSVRAHDTHDVAQHALQGMAGLVLGIRTVDRATSKASLPAPARHLRLFVQEAAAVEKRELRVSGYVLQRGTEPARDSVDVPGAPLVLTRGETTAITVINRTPSSPVSTPGRSCQTQSGRRSRAARRWPRSHPRCDAPSRRYS